MPNFPSETALGRLSVSGLVGRARSTAFFPLLLWTGVPVVLRGKTVLADVHPTTVSSAGSILTVVGVAYLPTIWCGGVHEPRTRVRPKPALSGFVLAATLRSRTLFVARVVVVAPFAIALVWSLT